MSERAHHIEENDEVFDPVTQTYFRSLDDANEAHPLSDDAFWATCGRDGQPARTI